MKHFFTSALLFCWLIPLSSQPAGTRTFSARVLSNDNDPLAGVTVRVMDGIMPSGGAITDVNGYFKLTLKGHETLRFNYTGYASVEYGIAEIENELDNYIVLAEGLTLPEVVITSTSLRLFRDTTWYCCCLRSTPVLELKIGLQKTWEYFPNPTLDAVTVRTEEAAGVITVFSMDGRLVGQTRVTDDNTRVDLGALPPAVYLMYYENTGWRTPIGKVSVVR